MKITFANTPDAKRIRILVLAVLVILFSVITLIRAQCASTVRMDKEPFVALGEVVAEQTKTVLTNRGPVVIVTMTSAGPLANITQLEVNAYAAALKRDSLIKVAGTENYQPPPYVDSDTAPQTEGLTGEFLLQVVHKYPEARAIVSFAGATYVTEEQEKVFKRRTPRIIVASNVARSPRGTLQDLFAAELVLFAVTPRTTPPPTKKPETLREVFDQFYQIITPAQAGEVKSSY